MSAAEKLEALDEAMAPAPWTFVAASYADEFPDEHNLIELRNALPEIIAVVKAAEEIAEARDYWDWVSSFAPQTKVALSALDEALPQISSTPPPEGATSP